MASTVLPNGIIIPEKYSRDWYADLYHNWQELDNLLGGGTPKDGTLTIQKNGTTVGTFSANQATDETINIEVPDVNNGTLTIQQNGTTVDTFTANSSSDKTVNISVPTKTSDLTNDSGYITGVSWNDVSNKPSFATVATSGSYNDLSNKPTIPTVNNATLTIQKNGTTVNTFTANSSSDKTVNIQCVDLTNNQTVGGNKEFTGTTTAHDLVPSATDTYNFGSPSYQWNNAYIKSLTINGVACGDILTHNANEFVNLTGAQTIGGVKTFSSNVIIQGSKKVTCNLDYSFIELDGGTTWGKGGSIVLSGQDRSSYANSVLIVSKSDTNTDILQYQNGELKPLSNNTNDSSLGTSTNKWKSFNGINPGALSLPSTTLINVASNITALDGVTINKFTPQVDGWLLINGTGAANEGFIYAVQGRIGMMSANNTTMLRCAALIPVVAGVEVSVTCKLSTLTWANIATCQGNI